MKCQGSGKMAKTGTGVGKHYRICPLCGVRQYFNYGGKLPDKLPMKLHEVKKSTKRY